MSTQTAPEAMNEVKEVKAEEATTATVEAEQESVIDTMKQKTDTKASDDGINRHADHAKPEKKVSLDVGTRVEVLQTEQGLEGAWFSGTVLEVKPGKRLVRYDELLSDTDLTTKLSEWVAFNPPSGGKRSASSPHRPGGGDKHFHGIRPLPPPAPPRALNVGDYVEVNADDGNWLACILRVESDNTLHVLYPDTMDDSRVSPTQVRVAQQWDEVKDVWSPFRPSDIIRKRVRRRLNRIASQPPPVPSTRLHATTLARRTAAGAWVTPRDPKRLASVRLSVEDAASDRGDAVAAAGGGVTEAGTPSSKSGAATAGDASAEMVDIEGTSGGSVPQTAEGIVAGGVPPGMHQVDLGGGTPAGGGTSGTPKADDESARKRIRVRADSGLGSGSGGVSLMLRRLVESGAILVGEEVHYRSKKGEVLLTGVVREGGIECHHCNTVVSLSVFEIHSGSTNHRPSAHTFIPRRGQSLQDVSAPPATPIGTTPLFQSPSPVPPFVRLTDGADSPAGASIQLALTSVRLDADAANGAARVAFPGPPPPRGPLAEVMALQAQVHALQAELATKNRIIAEHSQTMAEVTALLPVLRRIAEPQAHGMLAPAVSTSAVTQVSAEPARPPQGVAVPPAHQAPALLVPAPAAMMIAPPAAAAAPVMGVEMSAAAPAMVVATPVPVTAEAHVAFVSGATQLGADAAAAGIADASRAAQPSMAVVTS